MEKNKPVPVSSESIGKRVVSTAIKKAAESGFSRVSVSSVTSRVHIQSYCINHMREIGAKASVKRVGDYYEITRTS